MKTNSENSTVKTLLVIVAVGLCFSLFGNVFLYLVNNQISTTLNDQKMLLVENMAFSLESLSALPVLGPLVREEYTNISIVDICNRYLVYHSQYARASVQQLIALDPTHGKNLTQIDEVFVSFGVFADNLNRLVSENKTSNAIELIDGYSKNMSNLPTSLGSKLQLAYSSATTDEGQLELALEQATQIQTLLDSMTAAA
jgi:hypothetical protein